MLHPLGYSIYYDAESLYSATSHEKQLMLGAIVEGILEGDKRAGNTAYCLTSDLVGIPDISPPEEPRNDTPTSHGKLTTSTSLRLLKDNERLRGFTAAIKRWPEQSAVIDVGCGPFPVLALAAAMYHPHAEVSAIEINQEAADAAREIVGHFVLSDRVHVVRADIANHNIDPNTTAAVTETFNSALQEEPGPKIVQLLHRHGIPIITPSLAELRLQIAESTFYQQVDLRTDTHANIVFEGIDSDVFEEDYPDISAAYSDGFGLVLPYDQDAISNGLRLRLQMVLRPVLERAGSSGCLTYELGKYLFEPKVREIATTQA
ncbi:MAG TPA: hypothetical protein VIH90_05720 [Candidatus Saccharimonadales bacterium]